MPHRLITSGPKIMMGKPVIAGTRITVELILEKLAAGETTDQILSEHPHLTAESSSIHRFCCRSTKGGCGLSGGACGWLKIVADENVDGQIVERLRVDGHKLYCGTRSRD